MCAVLEIGFVMENYKVSEAQKQVRVCIMKNIPTSSVVSVNVSTLPIDSSRAAESKILKIHFYREYFFDGCFNF